MPALAKKCWDTLPKVSAFLRAFRAASMISGPSTINMNIVGTGARVAVKPLHTAAAAPLDFVIGKFTGERTHFIDDALSEVWGMGKALPPALKASGRRARAVRELDELQQNALPGIAGKALRAPFKALSIPDQLWYDRVFHGEMWKLARRESIRSKRPIEDVLAEQTKIANALDPIESQIDDLNKVIAAGKKAGVLPTREQAAQLRKLGEQADALHAKSFVRKAALMGDKTVFTARERLAHDPTKFANLDATLNHLDRMAEHFPLINIIYPFRRTTANVVRETLRSTPLGWIWAGKRAIDMHNAGMPLAEIQERFVDDFTQATLGTLAMYYFIHMAANGQLKANPFKEAAPAERATEEAAGIVPNSVQVGDWSVPVSRLEPFGSMLLNAARAVEGYKAGQSPDTLAEDLFKTTENMLLISAKETWLDPLAEFTEAIQDDKSLGKYMQGIGATFVPRAVSANFDQRIKEQPAGASLAQGGNLVAGFRNAIPGQGEAKLGLFGEERVSQAPWMSRAFGRTGKLGNDPIAQEMVRVGAYHLPPTSLDAKEREALKISLGEDRLMRVVKGQAQKRMVQSVMQSPQYQQAPDQMKKEMIDYAYRQASDGINKRVRMLKQAKMPLTSRSILGL